MKMTDVDWNSEPSPEKFEMDAEFYPKRVAELEQQLAECQAREKVLQEKVADLERRLQRQKESLTDHIVTNISLRQQLDETHNGLTIAYMAGFQDGKKEGKRNE